MAPRLLLCGIKNREKKEAVEMFPTGNRINKFDQLMMAITFAEAGEREMALSIITRKKKKKRSGLKVRRRVEQRPVLRA